MHDDQRRCVPESNQRKLLVLAELGPFPDAPASTAEQQERLQ